MLEYNFPKRHIEIETLKRMSPDRVRALQGAIKFRLEGLLKSCDNYFENLIESDCQICQYTDVAYFDIPAGWGFLGSGDLLCNNCIAKWAKKFGKAPEVNREGEIVYEHSTIPEDTTSGGQADFGFTFG